MCFRLKIAIYPFWQICSKKCNCQFKLKIVTQTISNMKNSIVRFIFCVFDWKYIFFLEICSENQNYFLKLKLGIQICNMQNSMVIFIILVWKYLFCVNLIQNFKRVILRRNLVPTLQCLLDNPPLINFLIFFHT